MTVSALVLTTNSLFGEEERSHLLNQRGVELGEAQGDHIPMVYTSNNVGEARDRIEKWLKLPGITDIQLVSWVEDNSHG